MAALSYGSIPTLRHFLWVPLVAIAALALAGCADSHQLTRNAHLASSTQFAPDDAFFIAISRDGSYQNKPYPRSGTITSQLLQNAFSQHARTVRMDNRYQPLDKLLQSLPPEKYRYLVYPTILEWEDRATEWSGIPDKVAVRVEIIQLADGQTVDTTIIRGKSGIATFGGDHPQDLLPRPLGDYVKSLFSR